MRHVRIGVRLMLLLVALFAVFFAWVGVRREMQRIDLREELNGIELWREFASNNPGIYTNEDAWRSDLTRLDALVAERRIALGESNP